MEFTTDLRKVEFKIKKAKEQEKNYLDGINDSLVM